MILLRIAAFFVAIVGLSACNAHVPTDHLSAPSFEAIKSSQVIVLRKQTEIEAEVQPSLIAQSMGGGLIPALMDITIEAKRAVAGEEGIVPLRKVLLREHLYRQFEDDIRTALRDVSWLHSSEIELQRNSEWFALKAIEGAPKADAAVIVSPSYYMDPEFTKVTAKIDFNLYPTSEKLKELNNYKAAKFNVRNALYKISSTSTVSLPQVGSLEENVQAWIANNGKELKSAMNSVFAKSIEFLVQQLKAAPQTVAEAQ